MAMNYIKQQARIELAKRNFFRYCNLMTPKFYKPNRQYLIDLCDDMEAFKDDDNDVLIINVPPRHGKSLTATKYTQWLLGYDPTLRIMTGSYNERLSTNFSKQVRNAIAEVKAEDDIVVYSDVFPRTKIKYGEAQMNLWSLEGSQTNNYLATSPTGTATGFGADIIIIDDLIKNAEEANNANVLEKHWEWFSDTMLSRLESGGKIMLIMTRWSSQDLAGRALTQLPGNGYKVKHINLKAKQDDGTMLCDDVLSQKEFDRKSKTMSPEIASANYQQEPIDLQGVLYGGFKTYRDKPEFKYIWSYTDTADTGSDYFAGLIYGVTFDNEAFILDCLYTRDNMEVTEPKFASMLHEHKVNKAIIESNNGGMGYSRSVKRILKEIHNNNHTVIAPFTQTKNKQARILSNATWVNEHVYFPENWGNKWNEFYKAITTYQREGKNKHDDAPDALTGVAENVVFAPNSTDTQQKLRTAKRLFG